MGIPLCLVCLHEIFPWCFDGDFRSAFPLCLHGQGGNTVLPYRHPCYVCGAISYHMDFHGASVRTVP